MRFAKLINTEEIKNQVSDMQDFVDTMEEYGHCVVASDAHTDLTEKGKKLIKKLEECNDIMYKLNNEMIDWYSY